MTFEHGTKGVYRVSPISATGLQVALSLKEKRSQQFSKNWMIRGCCARGFRGLNYLYICVQL